MFYEDKPREHKRVCSFQSLPKSAGLVVKKERGGGGRGGEIFEGLLLAVRTEHAVCLSVVSRLPSEAGIKWLLSLVATIPLVFSSSAWSHLMCSKLPGYPVQGADKGTGDQSLKHRSLWHEESWRT